jgi:Kef-type K+ transport system membrane component KefB/nucleotide-binding universal stress UspA family protein
MTPVPAIPGHYLFLLLLQVSLLLAVSRLFGELAKRFDQPPVVGELAAGIVLGPSLLGWLWPTAFRALFPPVAEQMHLLELLGWLGMVLLLLLTGFETDVRRLRHLGRAALAASLFGMIVPFAFGWLFAAHLPDALLVDPSRRGLFAAFFATAMAISAMPVIAKILHDLELTRRDIGLLILSAGVVDDTVGWIVLSVIAGIVRTGFSGAHLARTLAFTFGFTAAAGLVLYPIARGAFRFVEDRFHSRGSDLTLILIFAFVCAAITEAIGIHAIYGAFIAGCLLRQVPRMRASSVQRIESVVITFFAPLFFGLVGLKVDLRSLGSPWLLGAALAVAVSGKLVGCTLGGLVGRLSIWESIAVGTGMNARGAMGLVVALMGLSLGILGPQVYAVIVVIAVVTSLMAPFMLRAAMRRVGMSDEERARLAAASTSALFDPRTAKALLLTAGGPNALAAARIAGGLLRGADASLTALYIERKRARMIEWLRELVRPDPAGSRLSEHLEAVRAGLAESGARVSERRLAAIDPAPVVRREAERGTDLLLLGTGMRARRALRNHLIAEVLADPPCHVVLVSGVDRVPLRQVQGLGRPSTGPVARPKSVLVSFDGSDCARAAVELAVHYAEGAARVLTILYTLGNAALFEEEAADGPYSENFRRMLATTMMASASPLLARTHARIEVLVRDADPLHPPLLGEAASGSYEAVVVGAESRAVLDPLGTGYDLERLLLAAACTVVVVVPRFASAAA